MTKTVLMMATALSLLSVMPATAEIYKYRDSKGIIRYTYDLAEVPDHQRPQVQSFEEEASPTVEPPKGTDQSNSPVEAGEGDTAEEAPPVIDEKTIESLNQKKKELDQEFAALMEEKYSLLKEKEKLDTLAGRDTAAVAAYDQKVEDLNRRIVDYQKRQEAFQQEADGVKKAIDKSASPPS